MVWPSLDVPTSRGIGLPGRRQTVASGTIRLFMHITMSPCRRRGRVGEWEKDMKRRWYVATNEGGKKGGAFMISSRTPWHPVKAGRPATLSDGAHSVHRFDWWWSPQLQGYSARCHRRMPRDHERDRATTTGTIRREDIDGCRVAANEIGRRLPAEKQRWALSGRNEENILSPRWWESC